MVWSFIFETLYFSILNYFKRGPRKETAEIIRKALIHFGVITEDMKTISLEDVSIDSITNEVRISASHYNSKQTMD